MKFKVFRNSEYWYGVYKSSVRPVLLEYVESTEEEKWDDALLQAFDFIAERLLAPEGAK